METFSALLALCAGIHRWPVNSPHKRSVTRNFDVFFDLRLNKWLSKQSWGWWFETPSCPLWHHCNELCTQFALCCCLAVVDFIRDNMPDFALSIRVNTVPIPLPVKQTWRLWLNYRQESSRNDDLTITHWSRNKMVVIFQTTCSNAFSWRCMNFD